MVDLGLHLDRRTEVSVASVVYSGRSEAQVDAQVEVEVGIVIDSIDSKEIDSKEIVYLKTSFVAVSVLCSPQVAICFLTYVSVSSHII